MKKNIRSLSGIYGLLSRDIKLGLMLGKRTIGLQDYGWLEGVGVTVGLGN